MRQGKDLILSDSQTGSGHFACATSCNVSIKSDFIEVAHPTEGEWKRYKPTIKSWSASTGHLLASYSNYQYFRSMMDNKAAVTVRFYDVEMQIFYKGQAYIETLDLTGDVNGLAQMKVALQPSGPLEAAEEHDIEILTTHSDMDHIIYWYKGRAGISDDEHETGGVVYDTFNLTTVMRTRFTIRPHRALLKCTMAQLETMLANKDANTFNEKLVLYPQNEMTSVIVGPGTYTVVVNYEDQDGHEDGVYMCSF